MSAYRQSPFANLTPVVKNLLIINAICFIPFLLIDHQNPGGPVTTLFGAFYFNSSHFRPWQIITYMFMHGGWEHIIFNMFALFMFGPILEYAIGAKKFLNLYLICGIGGWALQMLVQAIEVHNMVGAFGVTGLGSDQSYIDAVGINHAATLYGIYNSPLVGASGAIFGVLVGFGMLFPNLEMMILFVPFPVKAKYLIPVYILIELYSGLSPTAGDSVAHFAHLGGALIAFILIKIWGLKGPGSY